MARCRCAALACRAQLVSPCTIPALAHAIVLHPHLPRAGPATAWVVVFQVQACGVQISRVTPCANTGAIAGTSAAWRRWVFEGCKRQCHAASEALAAHIRSNGRYFRPTAFIVAFQTSWLEQQKTLSRIGGGYGKRCFYLECGVARRGAAKQSAGGNQGAGAQQIAAGWGDQGPSAFVGWVESL